MTQTMEIEMIANVKQPLARFAFAMVLMMSTLPIWAQDTMTEAKAVAAYPLTMDHVAREFQASTDMPSGRAINELPLEDRIKRLDATPKAAAVLKVHGLSSRDFVMTGAAVGAAIIVAGLLDSGEKGPGPGAANQIQWAAAPPEHIKFYRDHKAEIDKLVAQMTQAILNRKN
ncbi:MAG: hypothetical protein WA354_06150 [Terracidiphilus sp.]